MQHLHGDDHDLVLRHEGEDSEPGRMPKDAEDHGGLPAEPGQHAAEDGHRGDLRHLADAHHWHDPLLGDVSGIFVAEKVSGQQEVAVVDHRIDERHHEQHKQEGLREIFDSLEPC